MSIFKHAFAAPQLKLMTFLIRVIGIRAAARQHTPATRQAAHVNDFHTKLFSSATYKALSKAMQETKRKAGLSQCDRQSATVSSALGTKMGQ